jgi:hypothetical protein
VKDAKEAPPGEKRPTPFWTWLREQRAGRTHNDLSEALAAVTKAVVDHGKPGSITLKITVKPAAKGDTAVVSVSDAITVKAPAGERGEFIFYADELGNLSKRDPRQPELPGMAVVEGGSDLGPVEEAHHA